MKSRGSCGLPIKVFFFLALFTACGQPNTSKAIGQPQVLINDINSQGAASVVARLNAGNGAQWQSVIRGIETGSTKWLDLARELLKGTDAGRTADLHFALSVALTRNAAGVLSMTGRELSIDTVCSVPYIEPTKATIRLHRTRVHAALSKVLSPELGAKKKSCLEAIDR